MEAFQGDPVGLSAAKGAGIPRFGTSAKVRILLCICKILCLLLSFAIDGRFMVKTFFFNLEAWRRS